MWKVARRSVRAHKLRFALTGIAVIIGVAFMSGTLVLTATIQKTFDDLFADINRGTDAVVRAPARLTEGFGGGQRPNVPASLVDDVQRAPGVEAAVGNVGGFYAQVVDAHGKTVSQVQGPPALGFGWDPNPRLRSFHIVDGRAPESNDEIVIDKHTATGGNFHVGDQVKVLTTQPAKLYSLVGIARFGTADSLAGAQVTLFTIPQAQVLGNAVGQYAQISVVAQPGVSQEQVKTNIENTLQPKYGNAYEVITGKALTKENQNSLHKQLNVINIALLIFAVIAVLVGMFIIYNTFSIVVAQRTREMALLRAIGASRRQVMREVIGEAVLVGLISSALGVIAGIGLSMGLRAVFSAVGFDLPGSGVYVRPNAVIVGMVVGVTVTVLAALWPARLASRVPPVAAIRDVAIERPPNRPVRLAIGGALAGLGAIGLLFGLFEASTNGIFFVGLGAFMIFIGVFVLGPIGARPISLAIGVFLPKVAGSVGTLARENAARNPKRTSTTATALMIGVALVGFITIFAASLRASVATTIDKQIKSDYIVTTNTFRGTLSPSIGEEIARLPEIEASTPLRINEALVNGNQTLVAGIDPVAAQKLFDFNAVAGSLADLGDDGIMVSKKSADSHHWQIGSSVPVTFVKTGTQPMRVAMIYKDALAIPGAYVIPLSAFERNFSEQLDYQIYAKLKPGVSAEQGAKAITPIIESNPNAKLQDNASYKADQEAQVNGIVTLVYVLLFLSIVIALIGIIITLLLSIHERTRELGLLRAVGMTRRQVRWTVTLESVIITLLGTFVGLVIGLFFGFSVVTALRDQGITSFAAAPGSLIVVVVIAIVLGVIAALYPARRAAKLDVLQAISTE